MRNLAILHHNLLQPDGTAKNCSYKLINNFLYNRKKILNLLNRFIDLLNMFDKFPV